jgi:enolase-phosphatase E1
LKTIQGLIWERGFREGELRSEVFDDVKPALERWHVSGKLVAIYSSGSVLTQRNVFRHSNLGDLTPLISAFFDTQIGSKREAASYQKIAGCLKREAADILFVSDSLEELDSARNAGLETRLCVRPGNAAIAASHSHKILETLDAIR